MDYKELLKKYMQHVGEYEGATFVNCLNDFHCDVEFTEEEVAELERIENEISE